jgi:hypothetical protein
MANVMGVLVAIAGGAAVEAAPLATLWFLIEFHKRSAILKSRMPAKNVSADAPSAASIRYP